MLVNNGHPTFKDRILFEALTATVPIQSILELLVSLFSWLLMAKQRHKRLLTLMQKELQVPEGPVPKSVAAKDLDEDEETILGDGDEERAAVGDRQLAVSRACYGVFDSSRRLNCRRRLQEKPEHCPERSVVQGKGPPRKEVATIGPDWPWTRGQDVCRRHTYHPTLLDGSSQVLQPHSQFEKGQAVKSRHRHLQVGDREVTFEEILYVCCKEYAKKKKRMWYYRLKDALQRRVGGEDAWVAEEDLVDQDDGIGGSDERSSLDDCDGSGR